ncbi:MAG: sigma-70 family RNA polymerase sigma factor [Clostridia bacterium]|nr:sigma-70 family RNA polymerase sigma factor [Clostridia bacterium]
MTDKQLIELYWARSEDAIKQTERRYGRFCHALAYRILRSDEDAEECVNDTYLTVWNEIPPTRPNIFSAFLAKITRNLAIKRYHHHLAQKRRGEYIVFYDLWGDNVGDPEWVYSFITSSEYLQSTLRDISAE